MSRKHLEEGCFLALMRASFVLVIGSLLLILATVVIRGLPALNWQMISQTPKGGFYLGKEGGILNAILGSLYLAGGAMTPFLQAVYREVRLSRGGLAREGVVDEDRLTRALDRLAEPAAQARGEEARGGT